MHIYIVYMHAYTYYTQLSGRLASDFEFAQGIRYSSCKVGQQSYCSRSGQAIGLLHLVVMVDEWLLSWWLLELSLHHSEFPPASIITDLSCFLSAYCYFSYLGKSGWGSTITMATCYSAHSIHHSASTPCSWSLRGQSGRSYRQILWRLRTGVCLAKMGAVCRIRCGWLRCLSRRPHQCKHLDDGHRHHLTYYFYQTD